MATIAEQEELARMWKKAVDSTARAPDAARRALKEIDKKYGHLITKKIQTHVDEHMSRDRINSLKLIFYFKELVRKDRYNQMTKQEIDPLSSILVLAADFFGKGYYEFYEK